MLEVTWDKRLVPGTIDHGNWTARYDGFSWTSAAASALAFKTTATMLQQEGDLGADICHYAPPPADVVSTRGVAAVAFVDFPIT